MRIVLSTLSGILGVPYRVFIPCVLAPAWIFPAHPTPWLVLGLTLLSIGYLAYEHGYKPKANRDPIKRPQ